jgi:hypothetical protein
VKKTSKVTHTLSLSFPPPSCPKTHSPYPKGEEEWKKQLLNKISHTLTLSTSSLTLGPSIGNEYHSLTLRLALCHTARERARGRERERERERERSGEEGGLLRRKEVYSAKQIDE